MKVTKTIRLVEPTVEPITLAEAKDFLRVDLDTEDLLIASLITVARQRAERYCNRYFAQGQVALIYDSFPRETSPLYVPLPDVVSVDEIEYDDADGATQQITEYTFSSRYQLITVTGSWPYAERAQVTLTAGAPMDIDAPIQAMLLLVSDMYEVRNTMTDRQIYTNEAVEHILYPYRVELGV